MCDILMGVTAPQWFSVNEKKKQRVIEVSLEAKFNIYITLQKQEHKSGYFNLRQSIVKVEQIECD